MNDSGHKKRRRSVAALLARVLKTVTKAGIEDAHIRAEVDGEIAEVTLGKPHHAVAADWTNPWDQAIADLSKKQ